MSLERTLQLAKIEFFKLLSLIKKSLVAENNLFFFLNKLHWIYVQSIAINICGKEITTKKSPKTYWTL